MTNSNWTREKLIEKYVEFFKSHDHKEIQNASLIPENDPTVLFTTAGMHPIVPYLLGQKHPQGTRLTNVQRCIRTQDIEEVGDTYHHTLFEMLGNWSLNDYFKKQAIEMSFEFLTKQLNLPIERLAVSVFGGDKKAPKDEEAAEIWKSLGIPGKRIAYLKDNWWETAGAGPCGTDTEMFYWKLNETPAPESFDPKDENWVEIWNDVLMGFVKDAQGNYKEAELKNIDTGMGVERTIAILNGLEDNYLADMWQPIIKEIEKLSGKKYSKSPREMRIIADHLKASVFLINDGVVPGNSEQGYVLRRLIRRAIRYGKNLEIKKEKDLTSPLANKIIEIYSSTYPSLEKKKKLILDELNKEEDKFEKTLEKGMTIFNKFSQNKKISGEESFLLFQSYGFPFEITQELAKEKGIEINEKEFQQAMENHQKLSQTASAGKFKSGLADNSEATTKLHTAAHLLLATLKKVLKDETISQKGSNITPDRLRLDFSFPRKLTSEEITEVEKIINTIIQKGCGVLREEMSPQEAKKKGATGVFDSKYGDLVSVYTIGDISKEICTGPHVENIRELGKFKIQKETSSSSGVRRIKAVLE